jgi:hypothetical protein
MRIGLTRTKQLLIDRGVAVVAAIIRDEIKPAKIWLPAKKISRSHQTKTKRRRGEKKCLQRVKHSQNKICFSFVRFFFDSTSFQTRPLGHRLGPPTDGSWKSRETERMAPGKKKKKKEEDTYTHSSWKGPEKRIPPPVTDRARLTRVPNRSA